MNPLPVLAPMSPPITITLASAEKSIAVARPLQAMVAITRPVNGSMHTTLSLPNAANNLSPSGLNRMEPKERRISENAHDAVEVGWEVAADLVRFRDLFAETTQQRQTAR